MIRKFFLWLALLLAASAGVVLVLLYASLPGQDGQVILEGLAEPVTVEFDGYGIPQIRAQNRRDAIQALGFVTARDRMFQLDLMRRGVGGRLAEILGPDLLKADRWHRVMGFEQVAAEVVTRLDEDQKAVLRAYADGVNRALAQTSVLPFEFLILGYSPSPWRVEDSVLVILGMYEMLNWTANDERMASVMEATLPHAVTAFLMPDVDLYTKEVLGGDGASFAPQPIPADALKQILAAGTETPRPLGLVEAPTLAVGSNAWVVGRPKTGTGRAILANDMHLRLGIPNIWYRAELYYGDVRLAGLTLPGVPALVSGSNSHVAWGFTNIDGDYVDLVALDVNPASANEYQTPQGMRQFGERVESIQVRGRATESLVVRTTEWGPVLPEPLLGRPVAVHWTALDPLATNLDITKLDRVSSVGEAMEIFNRVGAPPQNVLMIDEQGHSGWTYMGRIPLRAGFDGRVSQSWADGTRRWTGYISPDRLPRRVDPASGFLVSANQRMLGRDYPYLIGHNFENGYRAYRITERLQEMRDIEESDMLALQLDTAAEFYRFYQRLALAVSAESSLPGLREHLEAWNGRGDIDSLGLALLVDFRRTLADAVFSPLVARCRAADANFVYSWRTLDLPLQQLLEAQPPELLPDRQYPDWNTFIGAKLRESARRILDQHGADSFADLAWGRIHRVRVAHPLSRAVPVLGRFLNMPDEALAGCNPCIRASAGEHGASERLVVSPDHEDRGTLHMPGGQSGHPLSPSYRDQQPNWVQGLPSALLAGPSVHRLILNPRVSASTLAQ